MNKTFVIWGCAGHAKVLASIIHGQSGKILAFFDNREVPSIIPGVPMYIGESGFAEWLSTIQNRSEISGLVAIGGGRGIDRQLIQQKFEEEGLNLDPIIHPTAFVCSTASIGHGSQILAQAVVSADSRLGKTCIINNKASIDHECMIGNGVHCAPGATVCGCVTIDENAFIGAGAIILPRLRIGVGSIVGAGAVVTKDVPDMTVVVGNPARIFKPV